MKTRAKTATRAQTTGGAAGGPAVVLEGLSKSFGATKALADVNLVIPTGAFTVLLGPSGSGKSTLLRCLAGIERASAGIVTIGGRVVAGPGVHTPPERRDLAMVFQDYALWPHMTVAQNVSFALRRRALAPPERSHQLDDFLGRVGLDHLAARYPSELSGGEQQRVALARALVGKPALLLFDEPLSNLDTDLRERIRVEIANLTRDAGVTAVYITHDQAEAFALADQVGVLSQGRLVQMGTPEEVYHRPATPFVARFTGLAGELAGTVLDGVCLDNSGHPQVTVEAAGGVVLARAHEGERLRRGDRARLLLRAAPLRLRDPCDDRAVLAGRILDVGFRGRGYDHVVELVGGERLVGIFDEARRDRGVAVGVRCGELGALAFPEELALAGAH
jgi:iron(III) transport system ATP-binding protein